MGELAQVKSLHYRPLSAKSLGQGEASRYLYTPQQMYPFVIQRRHVREETGA